jgi:hypothetical protein
VLSDARKRHLEKIEATMEVSDGVGLAHCLLLFRHARVPVTSFLVDLLLDNDRERQSKFASLAAISLASSRATRLAFLNAARRTAPDGGVDEYSAHLADHPDDFRRDVVDLS